MTYAELLQELQQLSPDELQQSAKVEYWENEHIESLDIQYVHSEYDKTVLFCSP